LEWRAKKNTTGFWLKDRDGKPKSPKKENPKAPFFGSGQSLKRQALKNQKGKKRVRRVNRIIKTTDNAKFSFGSQGICQSRK
jgi:hypothetical protein